MAVVESKRRNQLPRTGGAEEKGTKKEPGSQVDVRI
jgi:hypothetical protein